MRKIIPLSRLAIILLVLCGITIGICIVVAGQAYNNEEPYYTITFLGISMLGLIKVIISGSKRAVDKK